MQDQSEINNEDATYLNLKKTMRTALNFESDKYSDSFMKRRISIRMRACGVNNYSDYESFFRDNKSEQCEMEKNLTIHVTEFFRDQSFWDECRKKFFPDILETFKLENTITFWSAGCSSGQEAISILLTFLEISKVNREKIKIIGTDISEEILSKAKLFEYEKSFETKGLTPDLIKEYFYDEDGFLKLKDEYRENFTFRKHDILKDGLIKDVDVLFLRNTVIYFSKETKDALYQKIYENMKSKGFFVLGKTETLTGPAKSRFLVYDMKERIFQKE